MRLWSWALDNAPDGDLSGMSARVIAHGAGWGSADADTFIEALIGAGWLRPDLRIEGWDDGDVPLRGAWRTRVRRSGKRIRSAVRRAWEAMSRRVRPVILARDGHRCLSCGASGLPLEVDHIVSIARGGTNAPSNLQTLCKPCNRRKGAG
jgi:hypothetical protein